ncbi:hypothetical protein AURDEDRAFT_149894 [Auricularia subglabra TFB-10046 SS5]|nr:hypothetical protein AURDEDRAFT_149894 [Auricularia subglabra TFB-10046 SS5]
MARQSRSRPAARPAPAQTRSASTMTAPAPAARTAPMPPPAAAATAAPAQAASSGPGMLAQMAATAGSVAVGSTIGHGISNMLFGGRSDAAAPAEPVQQQQMQQVNAACDFQVKEFTKCLETNDVNGCNWYLEQLKACQAANAPRPFN